MGFGLKVYDRNLVSFHHAPLYQMLLSSVGLLAWITIAKKYHFFSNLKQLQISSFFAGGFLLYYTRGVSLHFCAVFDNLNKNMGKRYENLKEHERNQQI